MEHSAYAACDIRLNTRLSEADRARFQNPRTIQELLRRTRTVAVVGLSTEKTKASNMVASYLLDEGYRVIPVHPKADEILGQKVYRSLLDIPEPVDVVNVFRPANEVPEFAEQAVKIGAKALWLQLKIVHLDAAIFAQDSGLKVVVDRCIKMEHGRYGGMLHWAGMNTEVISAKRRLA